MFIRRKKNQSGKICIQVIDKSQGKYKVLHTCGSSNDEREITRFVSEAKAWIKRHTGKIEIDFSLSDQIVTNVLNNVQSLKRVGYDLLLGRIFNDIGFPLLEEISERGFGKLLL